MINQESRLMAKMLQNILVNTDTSIIVYENDVEIETELSNFLSSVSISQKTTERYPTDDELSVTIRSEAFEETFGARHITFDLWVGNNSGEYPSYGKVNWLRLPHHYTEDQRKFFARVLENLESCSKDIAQETLIAGKLAGDDPWGLLLAQIPCGELHSKAVTAAC
jgi:hypothetical protein